MKDLVYGLQLFYKFTGIQIILLSLLINDIVNRLQYLSFGLLLLIIWLNLKEHNV